MNIPDLEDSNNLLVDFFEKVLSHLRCYCGLVFYPRRTLQLLLYSQFSKEVYPAIFLSFNILSAEYIVSTDIKAISFAKALLPIFAKYLIGIVLFLIILSTCIKWRKIWAISKVLFTPFCYASVCYIPFAFAERLFYVDTGEWFYENIQLPLFTKHQLAVPKINITICCEGLVLMVLLIWWIWLFNTAVKTLICKIGASPRKILVSILGGLSIYIAINIVVFATMNAYRMKIMVTDIIYFALFAENMKTEPVDCQKSLTYTMRFDERKVLPPFAQRVVSLANTACQLSAINDIESGEVKQMAIDAIKTYHLDNADAILRTYYNKTQNAGIKALMVEPLNSAQIARKNPLYTESHWVYIGYEFPNIPWAI